MSKEIKIKGTRKQCERNKEKSVKQRGSILKNINKIDKPLARLRKQTTRIRNETQHRDFIDPKKIIREHYKLHMHKFDNSDKILEKHKLP